MSRAEEHRRLGIRPGITRRDFLNQTLVGSGGALLGMATPLQLLTGCAPAPEGGPARSAAEKDAWWGWGGVGDYAASAGNTEAVAAAAHRIRDGQYAPLPADVIDTGEEVDLAIVGAGMSGLGAALHFRDTAGPRATCVVLDNHPMFGGEAKENEFSVDGVRLVGPQGSNDFGVPAAGSGSVSDEFFTRMGLPREFDYVEPHPSVAHLRFSHDSYAPMTGVAEKRVDVGYWFGADGWVPNMWRDDLAGAPFSAEVRADLLRWRGSVGSGDDAFRRRLDTMTYAQWLEREMGLHREVTDFAAPVIGLINGASPDAVSAFASSQIGMPGVTARARAGTLPHSFPGGNTAFARYLVKALVPDAIPGDRFEDVLNGRVRFEALDRVTEPTRIRLGATVVDVRHSGIGPAERVEIVYEVGGRLYSLRAKAVVLASGGWVNRRIVQDLPSDIAAAYDDFIHAPALVANVALANWRFLAKLGFTAARWVDRGQTTDAPGTRQGNDPERFGFCCSLRRPMAVGDFRAPLDPDRPIVLTFYMGLATGKLPLREQCAAGRSELFETSFYEYERRLRTQMIEMFGDAGFDPENDIAGIVLNRWGHARLAQQPGFYFGVGNRPSPREVVEAGFGRVAIGHSELNGHQNWTGGLSRGRAAVEQIAEFI